VFDIGFSELIVIGLVALIVIGPERLPRVARTLGHLMGRLQRYVADVKADINREIELEELNKMRESVQQAASSIESEVQAGLNTAETDLNRAAEAAIEDAKPAPATEPSSGAAPAQELSHAPAGPAHASGGNPQPSEAPLSAAEKPG
jgi:sec-independent protein translocase protein TatB